MSKKVKIEINFDDNGKGIGPVMESIHKVLEGHVPYIQNDIVLSTDKPYDGSFKGDECQLYVDFNKENAPKHGIISDMTAAATIALLIAIKNVIEDSNNIKEADSNGNEDTSN